MGKSSSSLKKKRSKNSSQSRTRKKSKSKSRRNKSKKLGRRNDSISYSDKGDSRSSFSVSSSSSGDDYRSKRSRSRTRRDVKGSRKRARRQSLSGESSEDSPHVRKRKGSKRNDNYVVRKKSHQKKKPRRDVSISSTSSGSRSCSTCRGGRGSSGEGEFEWIRGRSDRKEKDKRRLEKVKSGSRSRDRSRSSSCSRFSESSDYRSKEKLTVEKNSRRLKSVITVVGEGKEERGLENDEHKDEMIYDHDDYPPCRSNDSVDGGSKRELAHHSHVASKNKRHIEGEKGEAVVSNIRTSKVVECGEDCEGQCDKNNPSHDGVGTKDAIKERKREVSGAAGSLNGGDLESILRQRALENLRRFRGGPQTSAKTPVNQSDSDVKSQSTAKAELFQIKSPEEDGLRVVGATQVVDRFSVPAARKDSTGSSLNDRNISDGNDGSKESGSVKHDIACPPDRVALGCKTKEKVNMTVSSVYDKSKLATSALRRELSNTYTTAKQVPASREPPQVKLVRGSSAGKSTAETAQTVSGNSGEVNNAHGSASDEPSSCLKSTSEDTSLDKRQDETKDGSQYEQKTMSVMRGGEMVQVSYKVYIPKKAPALARRPLKQ